MRIGVVTDSTADIPEALAEQHGIQVIPAVVVIEGQSVEDGKDISREEFYRRMPQMRTPPTTATPSPARFQAAYEKLLSAGAQHVLSIHLASGLSGIISTAQMAAQAFGERITVVDSQSLSMGLGFQVLAAAEAAAQGSPVSAILQHLEAVRKRIRLYAMLDTLEHIHRSGRVSWVTARLGALLRVKLFVEVAEGRVLNRGQTRTRSKGIARLKALICDLGPLERLALLHSNAEEDARRVLEELALPLPHAPLVVDITPVIGTHVGPNGLGIAAVLA